MKYRTSLVGLALVALIFAGCSKHPPEAGSANPNVKDFGVVEVTNGVQSRFEMGGGKVCFLTPTLQQDGSLMLAMTVEESGKVVSRPRVVTRSGMAFQISVGDFGIGMTPVIKK
jgi:hypothetical protein